MTTSLHRETAISDFIQKQMIIYSAKGRYHACVTAYDKEKGQRIFKTGATALTVAVPKKAVAARYVPDTVVPGLVFALRTLILKSASTGSVCAWIDAAGD